MPSLVDPDSLARLVADLRAVGKLNELLELHPDELRKGGWPARRSLAVDAADAIEALEGTKDAWRACSRRWAARARFAEARIRDVQDAVVDSWPGDA